MVRRYEPVTREAATRPGSERAAVPAQAGVHRALAGVRQTVPEVGPVLRKAIPGQPADTSVDVTSTTK